MVIPARPAAGAARGVSCRKWIATAAEPAYGFDRRSDEVGGSDREINRSQHPNQVIHERPRDESRGAAMTIRWRGTLIMGPPRNKQRKHSARV